MVFCDNSFGGYVEVIFMMPVIRYQKFIMRSWIVIFKSDGGT